MSDSKIPTIPFPFETIKQENSVILPFPADLSTFPSYDQNRMTMNGSPYYHDFQSDQPPDLLAFDDCFMSTFDDLLIKQEPFGNHNGSLNGSLNSSNQSGGLIFTTQSSSSSLPPSAMRNRPRSQSNASSECSFDDCSDLQSPDVFGDGATDLNFDFPPTQASGSIGPFSLERSSSLRYAPFPSSSNQSQDNDSHSNGVAPSGPLGPNGEVLLTRPHRSQSEGSYTLMSPSKGGSSGSSSRQGSRRCACCECTSTPMWRDGRDGQRLCNACGIRWQKYGICCSICYYVPRKLENNSGVCKRCHNPLPPAAPTRRRTNSSSSIGKSAN